MKGATSIQERLWELRKDKGLNLEELSKLTGISKSALNSYFVDIRHRVQKCSMIQVVHRWIIPIE